MAIGNGIRSILINGAYLVGSNWIEILLRAVYVVVITRALGPELYGVWAYVMATYIFAMSGAALGLEALVSIALGRSGNSSGSEMASALMLRLLALCLAAVGLAVFAFSYAPIPDAAALLLLVIPALFARSLSELIRAMFTGLEQAGTHMKIRGFMRACEVAIGIAMITLGAGIVALVVLHALSWVAEAIWCVLAIQKTRGAPSGKADKPAIVAFLRKGVPLGVSGFLAGWMTAAPLLLYAPLAPDGSTFGAFSLAMQLAMILVGSILGFFGAALPIISRTMDARDARAKAYGPLSAALTVGLSALAALLALAIGPQLIAGIFGPDFALTGSLLAPVAILAGIIILPTGFGQSSLVRGLIWPSILGGVLGSVAIYLTCEPFVSSFGPKGAVIAAASGWLIRAGVVIAASLLVPEKGTTA